MSNSNRPRENKPEKKETPLWGGLLKTGHISSFDNRGALPNGMTGLKGAMKLPLLPDVGIHHPGSVQPPKIVSLEDIGKITYKQINVAEQQREIKVNPFGLPPTRESDDFEVETKIHSGERNHSSETTRPPGERRLMEKQTIVSGPEQEFFPVSSGGIVMSSELRQKRDDLFKVNGEVETSTDKSRNKLFGQKFINNKSISDTTMMSFPFGGNLSEKIKNDCDPAAMAGSSECRPVDDGIANDGGVQAAIVDREIQKNNKAVPIRLYEDKKELNIPVTPLRRLREELSGREESYLKDISANSPRVDIWSGYDLATSYKEVVSRLGETRMVLERIEELLPLLSKRVKEMESRQESQAIKKPQPRKMQRSFKENNSGDYLLRSYQGSFHMGI